MKRLTKRDKIVYAIALSVGVTIISTTFFYSFMPETEMLWRKVLLFFFANLITLLFMFGLMAWMFKK